MELELAKQHWALLAAAAIFAMAAVIVLIHLLRMTRYGQLRLVRKALAKATSDANIANSNAKKAQSRLDKLQRRTSSTRPRHLREAEEALQDASMLQKIAADQLQIARNQVRRVICDEFPPQRQAGLRNKYLGEGAGDNKPFSF